MKKLIYLCLMGLIYSGWALAQGSAFFDPLQSKAESCQHLEKVKEILSCEQRGDTDCVSPGMNYGIPPFSGIVFQGAATVMCSFQCVEGQERCDETLNPDRDNPFDFGLAPNIIKKMCIRILLENHPSVIKKKKGSLLLELTTEKPLRTDIKT